MNYILMRKNDPITVVQFSENGNMTHWSHNFMNKELAPLQNKADPRWLQKWWQERSIPIEQGRIAEMLKKMKLLGPEEYLIKNLGLSLTDYYWIKPTGSSLSWEKVNLFDNAFKENLFVENTEIKNNLPAYTPNSSLQGQLEKTWSINELGERILIKGNRNNFSAESINEVIVTKVNSLQGYDNFTPYYLLKIKNRDYEYGCYSKLFTSQKLELISAYAVLTSDLQPSNRNIYEQFIDLCGRHGIDIKQLRHDLEYQIIIDFVLTNTDRHMNNISVLRDADTLQFLRMAPIYDSGKSLFVNKKIPTNDKELFKIQVSSFSTKELKLLSYVQDRYVVNAQKLPSPDYIQKMYEMDSQMDQKRIASIVKIYEHKIDLLTQWQHGKNISPYYIED